jgi:hypothetical protein
MIHKFKVEAIENCPALARVTIDDKPIRCRGYKIEHHVDELPMVELEVLAIPECTMDAIVGINNKEEIASLMDKEEFEKFCEIWKEIHECEEMSK